MSGAAAPTHMLHALHFERTITCLSYSALPVLVVSVRSVLKICNATSCDKSLSEAKMPCLCIVHVQILVIRDFYEA